VHFHEGAERGLSIRLADDVVVHEAQSCPHQLFDVLLHFGVVLALDFLGIVEIVDDGLVLQQSETRCFKACIAKVPTI